MTVAPTSTRRMLSRFCLVNSCCDPKAEPGERHWVAALCTYQELAAEITFETFDLGCDGARVKTESFGCSAEAGMRADGGEALEALSPTDSLECGAEDRRCCHGFVGSVKVSLVAGSSAAAEGDVVGGLAVHLA